MNRKRIIDNGGQLSPLEHDVLGHLQVKDIEMLSDEKNVKTGLWKK